MKTDKFQEYLLKSAVFMMACDGSIESQEIEEISNMAESEVYFMGFDIIQPLQENIKNVKNKGKATINDYLEEIEYLKFNEEQKLLIIEVLIRTIKADHQTKESELKFLHIAMSKLNVPGETAIAKFPQHLNLLIDNSEYGSLDKFSDLIEFDEDKG